MRIHYKNFQPAFNAFKYNKCYYAKENQERSVITGDQYIKWLFMLVFLLVSNAQLLAQHTLAFSAGITYKPNLISNDRLYWNFDQENVISRGGTGYFASLAFNWNHKKEKSNGESYWSLITVEKFNSQLDDWERTKIGSVDAIIFRIEPLGGEMRTKNSKLIFRTSLFSINIFTGKSNLIPNSYCYDDENESWYLIEQMSIKGSMSWSFLDFEMAYKFTNHIQMGIETVFYERDKFKAVFQTNYKEITSDVATTYFFFPIKIRFTVKI